MVKSNPFRMDKLVTLGMKHIKFWQHSGSKFPERPGKRGPASRRGVFGSALFFPSRPGGGLTFKRGIFGNLGKQETMMSACYGRAEDSLYSGATNGDVYVWRETALVKTIKAHDGPVFAMCSLDKVWSGRRCRRLKGEGLGAFKAALPPGSGYRRTGSSPLGRLFGGSRPTTARFSTACHVEARGILGWHQKAHE